MSSLEHTNPAFASDPPALTATEPALSFVRASRRRFPSRSRQDHSPDTARERRLFVLGRRKPTIRCGDIWRTAEDLDVPIKCGRVHSVMSAGRVEWTS
jgi:hypothetical protein